MQFPEHLWFKSSRTVGQNECVEVALVPTAVGVRDTKDRDGGQLTVGASQWQAFLGQLKHGAYDQ